MFFPAFLLLALLSHSIAHASPSSSSIRTSRFVNVRLTASNRNIKVTAPSNNTVVTQFIVDKYALNSNVSQNLGEITMLTRQYKINTNVYIPSSGKLSAVLLAIHGIGFDSSYWDFSPSGDSTPYSFVDAALAKGYAVVSFDRLGTGKSAHPNGITDVQTGMEVEIAHKFATYIKDGAIDHRLKGKSVIGIGHSYGSIITNGVATQYPDDFSGLVLTGYAVDTHHLDLGKAFIGLQTRIATTSGLQKFEWLKDTSYFLSNGALADQLFFFHFPGYTQAAFSAAEASKSTYTLGQLLTQALPSQPAPNFKGPVLSVNGQFDNAVCGGNCYGGPNGTSLAADLAQFFPLSDFSEYIAPNTGHGLAAHTSAPVTNARIFSWLRAGGF